MTRCWKRLLLAGLVAASVQPSWAAIACPISLVDGKADQDGITLSFRNIGKLPIQVLTFNCLPYGKAAEHRTACHAETGLFFPGTEYSTSFAYKSRSGSIQVSLQSARLADGFSWLSNRDQRCRPLRVDRKRRL
jgi:hypothetical protein